VPVDPAAIEDVALLTIEGENDDITGHGQTHAAHRLCVNIPDDRKAAYTQPNVGHYGVFNGSRFRAEIAPRISDFIRSNAVRRPKAANAPMPQTRAPIVPKLVSLDVKRRSRISLIPAE
jgi:poly(3-hydroxybutyrate) depolymerase